MDREQKLSAIWRAKHPDYKNIRADGTKAVSVRRHGGTWSVPLSALTDAEIDRMMELVRR